MRKLILLVTSLMFLMLSFRSHAESTQELTAKANQQDPKAQYQLAVQLEQHQDDTASVDAFYWYQQSAELGYEPAQFKLAQALESGIGTQVNIKSAANWYLHSALQGNQVALLRLGNLYEQHGNEFNNLDLAQQWFGIAAQTNQQADQEYNRILELKFNQLRAKQVSAISQLDSALAEPVDEHSLTSNQTNFSQKNSASVVSDWIPIALLLSVILAGVSLARTIRKRRLTQQIDRDLTLEKELKSQQFSNKQLKRQLGKVFNEYKKLQNQQKNHKVALACAMFGYLPSNIPDEKSIKIRFRQLSKLYHPDARGSEEEMKRLNGALKVLLQNVTNK
ncbi:TPA: hypothetical protein ACGUOU_002046 [Vibrio vulnificus]